jgi:hypothetical protein
VVVVGMLVPMIKKCRSVYSIYNCAPAPKDEDEIRPTPPSETNSIFVCGEWMGPDPDTDPGSNSRTAAN